ncbi:MAG: hypothetical protein OXG71_03135 [Rhodospirillales bacterium]|nr:hypothetical protein [Rhodospirillales bacterium]
MKQASLQFVNEHSREYLTADERRRFIAVVAHVRKPADQTFVLTIAHTSARVSEFLVLRALDVETWALAPSAIARALRPCPILKVNPATNETGDDDLVP